MDREDYEISKGQLALLIGGAVSKFVNDTETENLTINVEVDRPTATFDETGKRCGNVIIRVYVEEPNNEDDED